MIANITNTIIFAGIATFCILGISDTLIIRVIITLIAIISGLFFAHRFAPKLTGKLVDKMCDLIGIE